MFVRDLRMQPNSYQWVLVSCVTLKRAGCVKKDREQFTLKSVESDCLLPLRIHAAQLATRKQLIPASRAAPSTHQHCDRSSFSPRAAASSLLSARCAPLRRSYFRYIFYSFCFVQYVKLPSSQLPSARFYAVSYHIVYAVKRDSQPYLDQLRN